MTSEFDVLTKVMYDKAYKGLSLFTGNMITIIGEQRFKVNSDKTAEQFIYYRQRQRGHVTSVTW